MEQTFSDHLLTERAPRHGSLVLAVLAGLATSILGSLIWMGITLITGWDAGLLALVIGAGVGLSILVSARGTHFVYGIVGAAFTLLSCLMGEIGVTLAQATNQKLDLYGVLMNVDLVAMASAIIVHTSPMMMVVYAIGAFEAYQLSFRKEQ